MLMQNSSKILQTVASNIDIDVIDPVINALLDMVMLTDQTGLLTGEEKVRVLGVQVAQQRETQRARQLEFLQMTANPIDMQIIGIKGRAQVLRSVATEIGLPGENIVPTDEVIDEKEKTTTNAHGAGGGPPEHPRHGPQWQDRRYPPDKGGRRNSAQARCPRPRHTGAGRRTPRRTRRGRATKDELG